MPATAYDAKGLLLEAIRDPDPVIFLEPLRGYHLGCTCAPELRCHVDILLRRLYGGSARRQKA